MTHKGWARFVPPHGNCTVKFLDIQLIVEDDTMTVLNKGPLIEIKVAENEKILKPNESLRLIKIAPRTQLLWRYG